MRIGVRYASSGLSPSGYGEAARVDVAALYAAGVNTTCETIQQTPETANFGLNGSLMEHLEGRSIPYKVKIIHLTPDLIPEYKEEGVYTIARLAWETDRLPKEWIEPLNSIDEIWTMSPQMCEMIKKDVTTICTPIPEPIDTSRGNENIEPFALQFQKDFIFYTIGQFIDRKNFRTLLNAYWKAFQGNDKVTLLIKTYRNNYSEAEYELIKRDIAIWKHQLPQTHFPKVYLVRKLLTDTQIAKLHQLGDCYVNPSSGEGWCRPMQEAMLYGNPVISGDNGGITDIMTTQHYFVVPSQSQQVTEVSWIPWYRKPMRWKALEEDVLGKQMQYVFNNFDKALEKGKIAQDFVVDQFSLQKVGAQMKSRLEEIYKQL